MSTAVLYVMVGFLILAALFPPWESPDRPEFLGFHFVGGSPGTAMISRMLLTIELVTIAVAGFYFSWLFHKRRDA